ncbi:biotin/lipoyl-containing protein [Nitratifractor salsuginis]|uniref:Biotin/lipoyl attachment domain-containing protein n=1 Tax=Nitratifractor salsuginis (strain DSM 16511 / JCM 12458 / E9I37-1) TaxID=749222 RepID=E6WYJ7_NITSE|nr:biotin/lipoyl-containing protein [Nitratifractor salsuginis]ADV46509.1 biotin/lipoyl attachment domain-containing protein [Nitratifractor salsuginis DSM 16511]
MAKKYIDVMDTSFRDGFQSVFGGRVLMEDFFPAVEAALEAGITHFEFGGGARFQTLYFYLREDAFEMMDRFREMVGPNVNLQILARGINTVMLDTGSREMIDLFAKLFAKHGTTTVRNFDALNDVQNLQYSGACVKKHGMAHEVVVTMMDLPPGCKGAHDVAFYEKVLREILESDLVFDSVAFKDASGTSNPHKVYETIRMARQLLGEDTHIRLHTHETAGVSVAGYLAALEGGANGIDLAAAPVSGGTSQPDILTLMHALKGTDYDLGGLDLNKVRRYEKRFRECLKDYFIPPEATRVNPIIPFAPMPGGALTANTQMMRDSGNLDKFDEVIEGMTEVVEKGGYGTSVTPVSQFYWQQAYANVMFGPWKKIAPGYGKMVLGYFGRTPMPPDPEIVELAREQLHLEPTEENPLDIADRDEKKSIAYWKAVLQAEGIEATEENIFIAAACDKKGIAYLKGESPLMVRKGAQNETKQSEGAEMAGNYTVIVDGKKYSVQVSEGEGEITVQPAGESSASAKESPEAKPATPTGGKGTIEVEAQTPGTVWKILKKPGDHVDEGEPIMILEAMKMEIEVAAPMQGTVATIDVEPNEQIEEGRLLATLA